MWIALFYKEGMAPPFVMMKCIAVRRPHFAGQLIAA